jgi:hypothetical protein
MPAASGIATVVAISTVAPRGTLMVRGTSGVTRHPWGVRSRRLRASAALPRLTRRKTRSTRSPARSAVTSAVPSASTSRRSGTRTETGWMTEGRPAARNSTSARSSCPARASLGDPECQDEGAGGAARDGEHAGQHPDDARAIQRLDDVRDLGEVAQRLRDGDLHGDDRARLGLDDDGGEAHRVVRGRVAAASEGVASRSATSHARRAGRVMVRRPPAATARGTESPRSAAWSPS